MKTLAAVWRPLNEPPKVTGRYCVGHRGLSFGDAYYTAKAGDTHYPVGWDQMPPINATHWLDNMPKFPPFTCSHCDQLLNRARYTAGVRIEEKVR